MSINQEVIPTCPEIPAALKKSHKPTLIFKMPIEKAEAEEEEEERRQATRYSFIDYNYKRKKKAG